MDDNSALTHASEHSEMQIFSTGKQKKNLEKFAPLLLGLAISLAVCIPFFKGGYLLLLDWVVGPHTPIIDQSFYGLQGGINAAFLNSIAVGVIAHLFGPVATWLPIFFFFPLACISVASAIKGNLIAKLAAGLFFAINPFVLERIYAGQLGVIYGYLLLPILYVVVDRWIRSEVRSVTYIALVLTLMISIDAHYAWIGGIIVLIGIILGIRDRAIRRSVPLLLTLIGLLNIYLVIPLLGHPLAVNQTDNQTLLNVFSTRGDPHLGLFANVLGLYGFWRPMHESSKTLVSGWPILLAAILLLSLYGLKTLWNNAGKKLASLIAISFIAGYFLALGSQGPTGSFFNLLYQHLPGFSMMREPEKFSAILATGIAILLGNGLSNLSSQQTSKKVAILTVAAGALLEIAYNPIIFWGLHGQVQTSKLPRDWSTVANRISSSDGKVLILPWHLYLSFPFTQKRIIANPGPKFIAGDTISGDNLQVGQIYTTSTSARSAYITWLTQNEYKTDNFGKLLAPIGVQYIVVYKTYSTGSTTWINQQKDLKVMYSSNDIELLKNTDFAGLGQILQSPPVSNFGTLLSRANSSLSPCRRANALDCLVVTPVDTTSSNISITYKSDKTGWLNIDASYYPGWKLDNHQAVQSVFGTLLFKVTNTKGTISFSPFTRSIFGYLTSGLVLLLVIASTITDRKQRTS